MREIQSFLDARVARLLLATILIFLTFLGSSMVVRVRVVNAQTELPVDTLSVENTQPLTDEQHCSLQDLMASYGSILSRYVSSDGLVAYEELQKNKKSLDKLVAGLARCSQQQVSERGRDEQIAFWINAYNLLTLKSILDAYPIQSSFFASLRYPKNSIRQIPGVWDKTLHTVAGSSYTLDHIEHEILRNRFKEPRVHVALVCAAKSCPPLRREPYDGSNLEEQLSEQATTFLSRPNGMRIEYSSPKNGRGATVYLSKIFDWFAKDFLWRYPDQDNAAHAVRRYVLEQVADEKRRELLNAPDTTFRFLDYDWTLNDQSASQQPS